MEEICITLQKFTGPDHEPALVSLILATGSPKIAFERPEQTPGSYEPALGSLSQSLSGFEPREMNVKIDRCIYIPIPPSSTALGTPSRPKPKKGFSKEGFLILLIIGSFRRSAADKTKNSDIL